MRAKTIANVLIGVLSIALLLQLGIYAYENIIISSARLPMAREEQPGMLTAFLVARPDLVVDSSNLSRVEIWLVPASKTEISEDEYVHLGNAVLQSGSDPLIQIWHLPIPEKPVAATEIFAKGFDMEGEFVGQMSLPYLGATQIFNVVWASAAAPKAPASPDIQRHFSFALKVGEKTSVGGLTVGLIAIEKDNRCPSGAVCIWAGEVVAKVQLAAAGRDETVTLHSMSAPSVFGGYQIGMTGVAPSRLGSMPAKDEYRITFSVEKI